MGSTNKADETNALVYFKDLLTLPALSHLWV